MGEVLAVLSGKGGTGKTSVCAGLACALAEAGKKVLCVDCDVGLRNLDISLGLSEGAALSFLDVAGGNYPLSHAALEFFGHILYADEFRSCRHGAFSFRSLRWPCRPGS